MVDLTIEFSSLIQKSEDLSKWQCHPVSKDKKNNNVRNIFLHDKIKRKNCALPRIHQILEVVGIFWQELCEECKK